MKFTLLNQFVVVNQFVVATVLSIGMQTSAVAQQVPSATKLSGPLDCEAVYTKYADPDDGDIKYQYLQACPDEDSKNVVRIALKEVSACLEQISKERESEVVRDSKTRPENPLLNRQLGFQEMKSSLTSYGKCKLSE